jgi:hypothetical protein
MIAAIYARGNTEQDSRANSAGRAWRGAVSAHRAAGLSAL